MRPLSAVDLLSVWEQGCDLHGVDQALLVLRYACPEYLYETLTNLSLGQRDALLLRVRQQIFGDRLEAYTECPGCQERLEFCTSCHALLVEAQPHERADKTIVVEGVQFNLRPPDSHDAATAATSKNVEAATRALLDRCVTQANDSETGTEALPASVRMAIAKELAVIDPQAEILLDLSCPTCGNQWQGLFDIVSFLWAEIRARARRLLQEVDTLARAYGWAETDILGMSETRRRSYVQMAVS